MNWLSRALRWAPWAAVTVMVIAIIIWLTGPYIVSSVGATKLAELLGRPVSMGHVRIEPWDIAVSIDDLQIGRARGDAAPGPQLRVGHLRVNLDIRGLLRGAPVIESLDVVDPALQVARTAPGRFDVDDIVQRLAAPPAEPRPDGEVARFALFNVKLRGGRIDFDDRPVSRKHEVRDLELGLPFLSSLPADVNVTVQPKLAFALDGTRLESGAQTKPFADDRTSELNLKIGDVNLAEWAAYWPSRLPVRVPRGIVSADVVLDFSRAPQGDTHLRLRGALRSRDLALTDTAGQPVAEWRAAELVLADVRPLERQVLLDSLRLDAPQLTVSRDAKGALNLAQLAAADGAASAPQSGAAAAPAPRGAARPAPPASSASAPAAAPAGSSWRTAIKRIEVKDGLVRWADAQPRPAVAYEIGALQLGIDNAHWPLTGAVPWKVDGLLRNAGTEVGKIAVAGEAGPDSVKANADLGHVALAAFDPYLADTLARRLEGDLSARLSWRMDAPFGDARQTVDLALLVVDNAKLAARGKADPNEALPNFRRLEVEGAQVDPAARRVTVSRVSLSDPVLWLKRDAKGALDASSWLVQARDAGSARRGAASPAWSMQLGQLALEGGRVRWLDRAPPLVADHPAALGLDGIRVKARNLAWPGKKAGDVEISARWRPVPEGERPDRMRKAPAADERGPGRIEWVGSLTPEPLALRGRLTAERLPIHTVQPYLRSASPVDLLRADAGFRGTVDLRDTPAGWQGRADGDALLTDVRVFSRPPAGSQSTADQLLTWQSLRVPGVRAEFQPGAPPSLQTGEGVLTDFYASLVSPEQGRLNLADVRNLPAAGTDGAGGPPANETNRPPAPNAVALGPEGSGSAPEAAGGSTAAEAASRESGAVQLALGGLQLVNGKIDFSDHFVKPNYSAALTELNGRIGTFRSASADMAPIELRGRAAGTAMLDVRGAINPVAKPLALEIQARASDLELAPLSPYAGKYVGYEIERGKLTMDVRYTIKPDGQLTASNQIVLNQLTFGDKVESPNATSLPVRFAVALLKDRNGVIDLNLPISGSLNDPQFSFGGLIVKVLVNLLTKAVTSPFSLLTGGGEQSSAVEFVPGTASLAPSAAAAIGSIGKALQDRPNLQLTIAGAADPVAEREAIQQADVDARVLAEMRKARLDAGQAVGAPASAPAAAVAALSPADRERYLREVYSETELPNKPRNLLGFAKRIPAPEMEALLRQATVVSNDSARDLALKRGIAVRDALVAQGLPTERIFLAAPKVRGSGEDGGQWTPSVDLSLAPR